MSHRSVSYGTGNAEHIGRWIIPRRLGDLGRNFEVISSQALFCANFTPKKQNELLFWAFSSMAHWERNGPESPFLTVFRSSWGSGIFMSWPWIALLYCVSLKWVRPKYKGWGMGLGWVQVDNYSSGKIFKLFNVFCFFIFIFSKDKTKHYILGRESPNFLN